MATEKDAAQQELPDDDGLEVLHQGLYQSVQWIASDNTLAVSKVPLEKLSVGAPGGEWCLVQLSLVYYEIYSVMIVSSIWYTMKYIQVLG